MPYSPHLIAGLALVAAGLLPAAPAIACTDLGVDVDSELTRVELESPAPAAAGVPTDAVLTFLGDGLRGASLGRLLEVTVTAEGPLAGSLIQVPWHRSRAWWVPDAPLPVGAEVEVTFGFRDAFDTPPAVERFVVGAGPAAIAPPALEAIEVGACITHTVIRRVDCSASCGCPDDVDPVLERADRARVEVIMPPADIPPGALMIGLGDDADAARAATPEAVSYDHGAWREVLRHSDPAEPICVALAWAGVDGIPGPQHVTCLAAEARCAGEDPPPAAPVDAPEGCTIGWAPASATTLALLLLPLGLIRRRPSR